jgi:hypothetical protein
MCGETMKESTKEFLARSKYRFFNGTSFAGVLTGLLGILTFAKVWAPTFEFYGISPVLAYVSIPAFYILFCYFGGFAYELSGIQAKEISHQNKNVNPEVVRLLANGDKSNALLEKIMIKLDVEK